MANILIVDDAIFMRTSIKRILEAEGHTVVGEAGDGETAIEMYNNVKPDVTILDITMPGMTGIETLTHIKEQDLEAKVVICSAMGHPDMIAKAIELGAKEFIVKPFEAQHLVQAVEKTLR